MFLPTLTEVIRLKREEAAALAGGRDRYDALIDDYEPSATAASISAIFDRMRPRLVALREAVLGAEVQPQPLTGHFGLEAQVRMARDLAATFGYDWTRGRMDMAVHPFSSGSGSDVRITTRVVEADPFNCFYSTIHEVGHAAYELGIDPDYALTPIGAGVSMGVHESQSRIYENQLGRSRAFTGWLYGRMSERFGDFGIADAEAFYATANRVQSGYIRTEADEVHYNLHIMMRFDLERGLIRGTLEPEDLEEAWNARFLEDFGVAVDRPSHGMLQDVHWSVGLFGYFPTYALGNVYAGCLMKAIRAAVPDLDDQLARGDTSGATGWLRENLQRHGGSTGRTRPSPAPAASSRPRSRSSIISKRSSAASTGSDGAVAAGGFTATLGRAARRTAAALVACFRRGLSAEEVEARLAARSLADQATVVVAVLGALFLTSLLFAQAGPVGFFLFLLLVIVVVG